MSFEIQSTSWFKDSVLDGIVASTIDESCAVATMIAMSFVGLKIGYEWWRYSVNSLNDASYVSRIVDWNELIRVVTLVLMIGLYPALTESLTGAIRYVNSTTDKSSATKQKMEKIANEYFVQQKIAPIANEISEAKRMVRHYEKTGDVKKKAAAEKLLSDAERRFQGEANNINGSRVGRGQEVPVAEPSFWDLMLGGISNFFANIVNSILGLIAMIIKWVVSGYARVIYKLLLCIGPLAIAMSIFWKDKFMTWFESILNIGLTFYIMNVLDIMVLDYFQATLYNGMMGSTEGGIGQSIAFNLVIIGSYLSIFRITSLWVGRVGANAIMNKSMAFVGMIAAGAVMAAGGLAGGAGGAAGAGAGGGGAAGGAGGAGGVSSIGGAGSSGGGKMGGSIGGGRKVMDDED